MCHIDDADDDDTECLDIGTQYVPRLASSSFRYLNNIEKLNIEYLELDDNVFKCMSSQHLHTLNMRLATSFTDTAFYYMSLSNTRLHTLDISYCHNITDQSFQYLTSLRKLSMSNACNIQSQTQHFHISPI